MTAVRRLSAGHAGSRVLERLADVYVRAFRDEPVHNSLYRERYRRPTVGSREHADLQAFRARELAGLLQDPKVAMWVAYAGKSDVDDLPLGYVLYQLPKWNSHAGIIQLSKRALAVLSRAFKAGLALLGIRSRRRVFDRRALAAYFGSLTASRALANRDAVHMLHLAVDPDTWGRGVGTELVRTSLADIRSQSDHPGPVTVELLASDAAIPLYMRLGFHVSGEVHLRSGLSITKMQAIVD